MEREIIFFRSIEYNLGDRGTPTISDEGEKKSRKTTLITNFALCVYTALL